MERRANDNLYREPGTARVTDDAHAELRVRRGHHLRAYSGRILHLSRFELHLQSAASVFLGEVIQVTIALGGREVRLLAEVVQSRTSPDGAGELLHAHVLAVAPRHRSQFRAHLDLVSMSEPTSRAKTRLALQDRFSNVA